MATTTGSKILAKTLRQHGIDTMFYLMGGPMLAAELACIDEGIHSVDVRHEQAAAMMAHAYARLKNRVGLCMAASGPGTTNLITGIAHAWADAAPVFAIGGSAPLDLWGMGSFQDVDQVALMRPITKWADRVLDVRRIPDMVATAMRQAISGKPGPVYLDLPGDILYKEIEESEIRYPDPKLTLAKYRPAANPDAIREAVSLLAKAERPIIMTGSGIIWSDASSELQHFVEQSGIPFYTTPTGRGVIPDDHALSFLSARSNAFQDADLILAIATRSNYVNSHFTAPRFSKSAKLIHVNIEAAEIGITRECDLGIVGDAKLVLGQLSQEGRGKVEPARYQTWVNHLREVEEGKSAKNLERMSSDKRPIHPLRLCKEVGEFLDRDAILVVDGTEILSYARQSIRTFVPAHRLNSGVFGTMGVGLPFGLGAKVACPDKQVVVLHGDGSFGMNAMELDTAVRFNLPVVTVISLNGGWSATEARRKPGQHLGYQRYEKLAETLGCYGEYVDDPAQIKPALARAFASGLPAVINVRTDDTARAQTAKFTTYVT